MPEAAGSIAPQNTPPLWWSTIGPVWLSGITMSGPLSGPQSSR